MDEAAEYTEATIKIRIDNPDGFSFNNKADAIDALKSMLEERFGFHYSNEIHVDIISAFTARRGVNL